MKILVTGANGYLGQGIVKHILDKGHEVVATDFALNHVDSRANHIQGNIFEVTNPYITYDRPDTLLHMAWRDGFKHNSQNHFLDLSKHYEFIKNAIESGIKKICVMGSMHEIGFYEGCIDENTPTNPQSLYGISKNSLRQSIEALERENDFKFIWLRGFYIVGNNQYGCSVFSKIEIAEEKGEKTFPFTMGENQYDFLDYDEFCHQVAAAVCQDETLGIINCCSGKPMKLKERVEQFLTENSYSIKLAYGTFPDRPYDSKAIWGNNEKIMHILQNEI